jgi:autonomous glycyl radical cofactor GrcA
LTDHIKDEQVCLIDRSYYIKDEHVCLIDRSDLKYRSSAAEGMEPIRRHHEQPVYRRDDNKDGKKRTKEHKVRLDSQPKYI